MKRRSWWVATSFSLALIAAACLVGGADESHAGAGKLWAEQSQNSPALAQVPDFSTLAAKVVPAVVSIQVEQTVKVTKNRRSTPRGQYNGDPFEFFRQFGGGGEVPREFENHGLGSGFFISDEGLILTNNHVVEKADRIEVSYQLPDGSEKTLTAKLVGAAPDFDVALIQTSENPRAPVTYLGDSEKMRIGDWVMAVGSPFGLSHSVSVGIVSAKGRREIAPSGRQGVYDFIQTDASINPGNSGGPLVNMRGEVIGINSAINAAGQGIGFAIPINMVKDMLPQLKEKGKVARSWIGVRIQPLTDELAQSYGLPKNHGALVAEVTPKSPGAEAGLREGDVIIQFDGKKIQSSSDLPVFTSMAGVGRKVELKVWRDRSERTVFVKLGEFPADDSVVAGNEEANPDALGMTIRDLTAEARSELQLSEKERGALVDDVEPGSVASRAGLRPGDVITGVDGKTVERARDVVNMVRVAKSGSVLRLQVLRGGGRSFVAIRKP